MLRAEILGLRIVTKTWYSNKSEKTSVGAARLKRPWWSQRRILKHTAYILNAWAIYNSRKKGISISSVRNHIVFQEYPLCFSHFQEYNAVPCSAFCCSYYLFIWLHQALIGSCRIFWCSARTIHGVTKGQIQLSN